MRVLDTIADIGWRVVDFTYTLFQRTIDLLISFFSPPEEEFVEEEKPKEPRMKPITPADVERIPEQYVKQIGTLKAEIARLQKEISRLKKENEILKGIRRLELIRQIEEKRRYLLRLKQRDYVQIGRDLPGDIKVFSKDNKFLGWFDSLLLGNGEIAVVISTEKDRRGRKYIVHRGPSLNVLFEHSENLADQIKHRIMILNRLWNGLYVPDVDVYLPRMPFVSFDNRLVCTLCQKEFRSYEELKKHYEKKHLKDLIKLAGGEVRGRGS